MEIDNETTLPFIVLFYCIITHYRPRLLSYIQQSSCSAVQLQVCINKVELIWVLISKADHPRMRAFSYAWSLLVRWRRWRLHHLIRHCQKPHATRKPYGFMFYIANRSFALRAFCTRWPAYTNLTRIPWRYAGCANMNILRWGFRKLSCDRQTRPKSYTTPLRGWSKLPNVHRMRAVFLCSSHEATLISVSATSCDAEAGWHASEVLQRWCAVTARSGLFGPTRNAVSYAKRFDRPSRSRHFHYATQPQFSLFVCDILRSTHSSAAVSKLPNISLVAWLATWCTRFELSSTLRFWKKRYQARMWLANHLQNAALAWDEAVSQAVEPSHVTDRNSVSK